METSLNSSQSEPTLSKNIFKKPAARTKATFEVSLNESSTMESQSNKSDLDLDSTVARKKAAPFKKGKKPMQQFNVTLEESLADSECDKTVANQKVLFKQKQQPQIDLFNVSYNESTLKSTQIDSLIESNTTISEETLNVNHNKSNPFRRSRKTLKENLVPEHNQMQVTVADEEMTHIVNKSNNETNLTLESSDINSSNFINRKNLFKRKNKTKVNNIENSMNVSSVEEDEDKSTTKTDFFKPNLFKKRITDEQMMEVSSTSEISVERGQAVREFLTPQEGNTFRRSSRLSLKDHSSLNLPGNNDIELETNVNDSFPAGEIEVNVSKKSGRLSKKELDSLNDFNISVSRLRDSRNSSNLSMTKENDLNSSKISRTSNKKQTSFNFSRAEEPELKSKNNSNISQKSKKSFSKESIKSSKTDLLGLSNTDQDLGKSRSSGNSFREYTDKNRDLNTMETINKNLSVDNYNLSKATNNSMISQVTFEQSSYNDDNLNNWMSDISNHSDTEDPQINLPPVPPIPTEEDTQKETTENIKNSQVTTSHVSWEEKFNEIVTKTKKSNTFQVKEGKLSIEKPKPKTKPKSKMSPTKAKTRPPKLKKPAPFATKYLYNYVIKRLEPKYALDSIIEAEKLIFSICDTVKKVSRKKDYQRKLIKDLKQEMAEAGIIKTTLDFYEFVIKFLPYNFRVKVVPCFQPITNTVYPPKDTGNPFDKIL